MKMNLEGHVPLGTLKSRVKKYWEEETCGLRYGESSERRTFLLEIESFRYSSEPFILGFADFQKYRGKSVLEIGVGAGVDFRQWVNHGAHVVGIDLTEAALKNTKERLRVLNPDKTNYALVLGDAEYLCLRDNQFDLVYAYGCFHHTPDVKASLWEAFRVLKPGGELKTMIYHVPSWTGWILWLYHCLLKGKPWQTPRQAIFEHLESPSTKAFTIAEAKEMLAEVGFDVIEAVPQLGPGDLQTIRLSKKYQGLFFQVAQKLYPRWMVKRSGDRFGLVLLVKAVKPK